MLCCGQVRPLGANAVFANILTLVANRTRTIRPELSALFTGCGRRFPHVDGLLPNRPAESARGWDRFFHRFCPLIYPHTAHNAVPDG
jgi:hypothetical protein